nr:(d)CMP kinase [Spirochaetota bacterium]
ENFIKTVDIEMRAGKIFINGEDVTPFLRSKEVTETVSPISNSIPIRKKVNEFLNVYAERRSIIMDGRDIGTVVFPRADYKFYMDASVDIRAKRRFEEKTTDMSLEDIKLSIEKRDANDKAKPFGALKIAEDAIYLDTTNLSIDEVVDNILKIIKYNGV